MYQFDFTALLESFHHLLAGAAVTLELSCGAMVIGLMISIACAVARTSRVAPLRWLVRAYVELFRNTPFLVQIFFIYFGLPEVGIAFEPNFAALVALTVNVGAYGTEIIRAGIESIQHGQVEAGIALGLKRLDVFRYVILKPALRAIYPALTSQFVFLMLTSSVVSVISATDLTAAGNDIQAQTFASFEVYTVVTIMYFIMSSALSALFSLIHRLVFHYPVS